MVEAAIAAVPTLGGSVIAAGVANLGGQIIDNAFSGKELFDIHYGRVGVAMASSGSSYFIGKPFEKAALSKLTSIANRAN